MKKKKWMIAAVAVLVLILAGIVAAIAIPAIKQKNLEKRFAEQMDLGNRYLLEQDYEAAVLAFGKAIEIDPRQAESYRKMAEAYVGLGDYENAILTLEKGYEFTGEESLNEWKVQLEEEKAERDKREAFLKFIYETCQGSDEDSLFEIMVSDEYKQFIRENMQENKLPVFYPENQGQAMGIYEGGVYWGELKDGIRQGKGSWYTRAGNHGYISNTKTRFTGRWEDDYPNGPGEQVSTCWNASPFQAEGEEYQVKSGNYRDGYADGEFTEYSTFTDIEGRFREHTIHYKVNYGVYEIIRVEEDGHHVIADEDGITFTTKKPGGRTVGVSGAKKKLD